MVSKFVTLHFYQRLELYNPLCLILPHHSTILLSLLQSKMEDHLDEAINVLQRHASGPGLAEMHSLLQSGLGLPPALLVTAGSAAGLAGRLQGMVRFMNSVKEKLNKCNILV